MPVGTLVDTYGRKINYLRISVTDRCNLRCIYCMPPEGIPSIPHADILRFEEIARIVRIAAEMGITKIRLTGGEPLVRRDIHHLVAMLTNTPGLVDIAMTTNGTLLARYAAKLKAAGLHRVNVSLDTLQPARYRTITRLGNLSDALAGIKAAQREGLLPVKINMVVIRGQNDDEVVDFAKRTLDGWHVRFIEWMPLGTQRDLARNGYVPTSEIRAQIEQALGTLQPSSVIGSGPADVWRIPGASGTVGFISAISHHFCDRCNRLRMTAQGVLLPCLFAQKGIDIRTVLRSGASDARLKELLWQAVQRKPRGHGLAHGQASTREMSRIGG